jgi:sirohydrochlorin cobaltochelatase
MSNPCVSRRNVAKASLGVVALASAGIVGCSSASGSSAAAGATPKPAILVTSFGTSYASSRHATIGAIESDIREAYANYDVRRAFTAQTVIDHIESDTGRHIDNFEEAMDKLVNEGVKEVIVQPTHLMDGFEYQDIAAALDEYKDKFASVKLGDPLLTTDEDYTAVAEAVKAVMAGYEDEDTAVCLMGHGTEADSNEDYTRLQGVFDELGYKNYFVATVEATPTFADVAEAAKAAGYTKAVLRPLMVVAGDHANNDMADASDPESFVSVMNAAGFETKCVIEGLGQVADIDEIYVAHVQRAIDAN